MNSPLIIPSSTGKYLTTCKLCGRPVAETPALEVPVIGHPGKKVEGLMKLLIKHLEKYHQEEFQRGSALLAEFPAFLILNAFRYEDPSINPRLENIRAAIFAVVRKNTLSDASIDHIIAGFGLDPQEHADVSSAMRAIRDACCELGQHAPNLPAPPITTH